MATSRSILNRKEFEVEIDHQAELVNFKSISVYFSGRIINNLMNNIHTEALAVNEHLEKLFNYGHRYAVENVISSEAMDVALVEFYKCKGVK